MAQIEARALTKSYRVHKKQPGFANAVKGLFARTMEEKVALNAVSFDIEEGELIGYIGPNGAGKSTTVKLLAGILVPTSGTVRVCGITPHRERERNAEHIGVVFGQRSHLYWDLPVQETFELYRKMYRVEKSRFRQNIDFFVDLLDMQDIIRTQVRQLSLGQLMRANLMIAMLHDPKILYLDEPTIGLDVVAKARLRGMLRNLNEQKKTTIILTTHDMEDISELCDRIIMIHEGSKLYDGSLAAFTEMHGSEKVIEVEFAGDAEEVTLPELSLLRTKERRSWFVFKKDKIPTVKVIDHLIHNHEVVDFHVKEPLVEDIVRSVYEGLQRRSS